MAAALARRGDLRGRQRRPAARASTRSACTRTRRGPAHQGHVRNYTFGDLVVRYRTMQGYAVLSPFGFDSFGLPAENAAIKTGTHPRVFTEARIAELKESLLRLGAVYDWRREVRSHDPGYIRWTQLIFLRLLGRRAWPTGPTPRSTGARAARPCWPTSRCSPTGRCERSGRPRREAGPRAVVLPDHRLRRRAPGGARRARLARAGEDDAAQLDRAVRGRRARPRGGGEGRGRRPAGVGAPRLHDEARHAASA